MWLTLSSAAAWVGCAGNSAPRGWLLQPKEAQVSAYGGWIELTYKDGKVQQRTDGELIAVSADSVWVLEGNQGRVIATDMVKAGKLTAYAAQTGNPTAWTVGGTLATISNGVVLILTAPMWIIGGSLATAGESRAPQRTSPPLAWAELAPFARFPQGMPPGLDLSSLEPKKTGSRPKNQP